MLKIFKYKEHDTNTKYLKIKEQWRQRKQTQRRTKKGKKTISVILVKGLGKELGLPGLLKYQ